MAGRNAAEIVTGAAVLVVAGGFLAYAVAHSGRGSVQGYPLTARFESIAGLGVGSDVRLAGVKVGTVTATTIDPKSFQAVVTLTVRDDIRLPTDSAAQVLTSGLLGGDYLGLSPGAEQQVIPPDGQITITTPAVSLETELGKFIFSVSDLVTAIKQTGIATPKGSAPAGNEP